jgi:DNA-directed RNA polymerase specialized sigma24 family protein
MNREDDASAGTREPRVAHAPFEALLRRLGDAGDAGVAYERLRSRLIRFYRLHVPAEAEELADVTLERLARKLHEGIEVVSVPAFALGIARNVLHEARARHARQRLAEADPTLRPDAPAEGAEAKQSEEAVLRALLDCLDVTGSDTRTLILAYYGADGAERIAMRQRLAAERGIAVNALRNRALRLREALERCVRARLGDTVQR